MTLVQTIGMTALAIIGHSTCHPVGAAPRMHAAMTIQSDHGACPMNHRSRRRASGMDRAAGGRMIAAATAICSSGTTLQHRNPLASSPSVRCPVDATAVAVPRMSATSAGRRTAPHAPGARTASAAA
jgi:hypothetical protein